MIRINNPDPVATCRGKDLSNLRKGAKKVPEFQARMVPRGKFRIQDWAEQLARYFSLVVSYTDAEQFPHTVSEGRGEYHVAPLLLGELPHRLAQQFRKKSS